MIRVSRKRRTALLGTGLGQFLISMQDESDGKTLTVRCPYAGCPWPCALDGVVRYWVTLLWQPLFPLRTISATTHCLMHNEYYDVFGDADLERQLWAKVEKGFTYWYGTPRISITKTKHWIWTHRAGAFIWCGIGLALGLCAAVALSYFFGSPWWLGLIAALLSLSLGARVHLRGARRGVGREQLSPFRR